VLGSSEKAIAAQTRHGRGVEMRMFGWMESKAQMLAVFVVMIGCSSDAATDDDNEMTSGDAMGGSSTGGSASATAGSSTGGSASAMGGATNEGAAGDDAAPGFAADVYPILVANCGGVACHGDGSFLPQHAHSDVEIAFEEAQPVADRIAGRVSGQLTPIMPQFCGPAPGVGECLSIAEVQLIQAWAESGALP
jgi:hypothetical protein